MIDDLNTALGDYFSRWHDLCRGRKDTLFFDNLKPVALGWKVQNRDEYDRILTELHDKADKIIETWMNERWIAKVHLKDEKLTGNIELVKIMLRRPGSTDAVGLDHLDFYAPEFSRAEQVLQAETDLRWSWESNDVIEGYDWLSVWFDHTEAKIKSDTVLDIVAAELQDLSKRITGKQ